MTIFQGKERFLNAERGKKKKKRVTPKGIPIRLSDDFSAETLQAIKEWHDIFKVLKGKNLQTKILCGASLTFRIKGDIRNLDKKKLRICNY